MADGQLDAGFEEVSLDEGFEEQPLEMAAPEAPKAPVQAPSKDAKESAKIALEGATLNPLTAVYGVGKAGVQSLRKALKGEKVDLGSELESGLEEGRAGMAGAIQGATLGGADELAGLAGATGEKLRGSPQKFFDLYRQNQQAAEQEFKAKEEAVPTAYNVGEIGGGIASGVATAGLGAEGAIAKQLGSIGIEQAAKSGIGSAIKEVGKQALGAGIEGAVGGGLQAGLSSENTLENAPELVEDVASGAAFGGLVGGGVKGALGGVSAAKQLASKGQRTSQMGTLWNRVRAGQPVEYSDLRLAGEMEGIEDSVLNKFYNARKTMGENLDKAYQAAENAGTKVNINDPLKQAASDFQAYAQHTPAANIQNQPEYRKMLDRIFMVKDGNLSPIQAKNLAQEIGAEADKLKNDEISRIAKRFSDSVRGNLDQAVPDAAGLSKQFYEFNKYGLETLADKGKINPRDIPGFTPADKVDSRQGLQWMLKRITSPGASQEEVSNALHYMKKNLTALEAEQPGVFKALGIENADQLEEMLRDKSQVYSIANVLQGRSGVGEPISLNPVKALAQGLDSSILTKGLYKGTQVAAKAANVAEKALKKPLDFGRALTSLPEDELMSVAETLLQDKSKSSQAMGNFLKNAAQNKDSVQRNAALFVIQQNPKYRNLIRDNYFNQGQEEGEDE